MSRAPLVLTVLLSGCASQVPYSRAPRACQDEAVDIAWRGCFARTERVPDVWWVPLAAQNCGTAKPDGVRGFLGPDGSCLAGMSWGGGMELVWYGAWERTALAHEDQHEVDRLEGRPPDANHTGPGFAPGGAVEQCNARLAAAALCAPAPRPSAMVMR